MEDSTVGPDEENGRMREWPGWRAADDHDYTANLRVFSSDNWDFWITHTLARVSVIIDVSGPVLKTAILALYEMHPQAELRFTDPEIELGENLDKIFRIISQQDDDDPKLPQTIRDYLNDDVAYFVKRYDMTSTIDAIKVHLNGLLNESPPSEGRHVFVAAILEDWELRG